MTQLTRIAELISQHGKRIRSLETRDVAGGSVDYTSQSTIVGWGTPLGAVFYKRVSDLIEVWFHLYGVSDSINTTFTLPYSSNLSIPIRFPVLASDNGGAFVWGVGVILSGSNLVTLYSTANFAGWTASGDKVVSANFSLERT